MLPHARLNSKSVRGAVGDARDAAADVFVRAGAGVTGWGEDAIEAGWGGSPGMAACIFVCCGSAASGRAGSSRVLNTVLFPIIRQMPPPPPRPAVILSSRTCLASLNDAGFGFGAVAEAAATFDGVGFGSGGAVSRMREVMAFKRSSFVDTVLTDGVEDVGVSSSTIVIGTRRRFGWSVMAEGGDVGISIGTDRCTTVTQGKEKWGKGGKGAYRLSLVIDDEAIHACEFCRDRFIIWFDPECPLEVFRQGNAPHAGKT
jgi:hypothetical protein